MDWKEGRERENTTVKMSQDEWKTDERLMCGGALEAGSICWLFWLFTASWFLSPSDFLSSVSCCVRFPVILSIENHCSIQQQKKIAQHLKDIFGDKLDVGEALNKDPKQLPSPNLLKGKILLKVWYELKAPCFPFLLCQNLASVFFCLL